MLLHQCRCLVACTAGLPLLVVPLYVSYIPQLVGHVAWLAGCSAVHTYVSTLPVERRTAGWSAAAGPLMLLGPATACTTTSSEWCVVAQQQVLPYAVVPTVHACSSMSEESDRGLRWTLLRASSSSPCLPWASRTVVDGTASSPSILRTCGE